MVWCHVCGAICVLRHDCGALPASCRRARCMALAAAGHVRAAPAQQISLCALRWNDGGVPGAGTVLCHMCSCGTRTRIWRYLLMPVDQVDASYGALGYDLCLDGCGDMTEGERGTGRASTVAPRISVDCVVFWLGSSGTHELLACVFSVSAVPVAASVPWPWCSCRMSAAALSSVAPSTIYCIT